MRSDAKLVVKTAEFELARRLSYFRNVTRPGLLGEREAKLSPGTSVEPSGTEATIACQPVAPQNGDGESPRVLLMKEYFSSIFGESPVSALEQHAELCKNAAALLVDFFEAVGRDDWDQVGDVRDSIARLENEADEIKKNIRLRLPKSLFMPVPREDVLELLLVQDKIANRAKDVAGLVLGRRLSVPEAVFEDFLAYVARNVDAARQARKSVQELTDLFTSGFRGAEVEIVQSMINELDAIETDTDELQSKIRGQLYEIENQFSPIDMMFLYQVITLIGEVGDFSERTGRRLELMLST